LQKKLMVVVFALLMALLLAVPAQAGTPSVILDGKTLQCDTPPVIDNGRTLVPMRAIFEALGASVKWDGATKTVNASKGNTNIKLVIGGQAYKNGKLADMDVPAQIYNGSTMVPLRFVSEALGAKVAWDGSTSTVNIASDGSAPTAKPAAPAPQPKPEPKPQPAEPPQSDSDSDTGAALTPFEKYLAGMEARFLPEKAKGTSLTYQFVITDGHPGKYYITIKDGQCTTGKGTASSPTVTITVGEQLWLDIAAGKVNGTVAYFTGKFKIDGNPTYVQKLEEFFKKQ